MARHRWVLALVGLCVGLCVSVGALRECGRTEVCGVLESSYPPAAEPSTSTSTTEAPSQDEGSGMGGSGEGSGDSFPSSSPLVYDEVLLLGQPLLPAEGAQPSGQSFQELCSCGGNRTCSADEAVAVDAFVGVSFCGAVEDAVPRACRRSARRRPVGRLLGRLESASVVDPFRTRTMLAYESGRVFCRCGAGLRLGRLPRIEPWPSKSLWAFPLGCL